MNKKIQVKSTFDFYRQSQIPENEVALNQIIMREILIIYKKKNVTW